jgi:hypothetical protein
MDLKAWWSACAAKKQPSLPDKGLMALRITGSYKLPVMAPCVAQFGFAIPSWLGVFGGIKIH